MTDPGKFESLLEFRGPRITKSYKRRSHFYFDDSAIVMIVPSGI